MLILVIPLDQDVDSACVRQVYGRGNRRGFALHRGVFGTPGQPLPASIAGVLLVARAVRLVAGMVVDKIDFKPLDLDFLCG
jgi:hypothetical protein